MEKQKEDQATLSLIVGLRNNLDYTKHFYKTLRDKYPRVELVFVSYGSQDGTHDWLDSLEDPYLIFYYSQFSKTLSDTYNKGVSMATSDLVAFLHNDMVVGNGFVESLLSVWLPRTLLFYTVVEPPYFEEDKHDWKITKDFGTDLKSFHMGAFEDYLRENSSVSIQTPHLTTDGTFFLCVEKKWLLDMGGLDPVFNPMFCEDTDLLLRFHLQHATMYVVPGAKVYHFVSKTSRFSSEYEAKTRQVENESINNFYRKWRFGLHSSIKERYDLAAIVKSTDPLKLDKIEPYFGTIYLDSNSNIEHYIGLHQSSTDFDLRKRILPRNKLKTHSILVEFDMRNLKDWDYDNIKTLPQIIHQKISKKRSFFGKLFFNKRKFRIGRLKFNIKDLNSTAQELVCKNLVIDK
ncbi:glycosyltransferase family 2 protein [Sphingobacterium chungjuense]|uniref:glycosyltransferase family 2 protein n=1 Tax=Sphingobacterium chungjuense TaxID=2675553 RepID=UPI00140E105A|nr:glycosyltransferase [Sphingobacterium chungjuense]